MLALAWVPLPPVTAQDIVASHAFSADELTALPQTNWVTNGGNTYNPRYSTFAQINRFNVAALQADLDNGSTIYDNACSACHGETGEGGQGGGTPLTGNLSLSQVMLVVNGGRNTMPAFDVFTEQELIDISTFVTERLKQ